MATTVEFTAAATCPKCGTRNRWKERLISLWPKPQMILCDIEQGGCDQYFAVRHTVAVDTTVFHLVNVYSDQD